MVVKMILLRIGQDNSRMKSRPSRRFPLRVYAKLSPGARRHQRYRRVSSHYSNPDFNIGPNAPEYRY